MDQCTRKDFELLILVQPTQQFRFEFEVIEGTCAAWKSVLSTVNFIIQLISMKFLRYESAVKSLFPNVFYEKALSV